MNASRRFLPAIVLALGMARSAAPQEAPSPLPAAGAYYFYWYRHPDSHFTNADGTDGLGQHFADPAGVDFLRPEWHAGELRTARQAGLEFLLPVYWGIPDRPDAPCNLFSNGGLAPLAEALDTVARDREGAPKIGLFYDTSTLLRSVRGEDASGSLDLTTAEHRTTFVRTVVDFFRQIPRRHWFTFRRPAHLVMRPDSTAADPPHALAVLYSSFGAPHDRRTFDALRRTFFETFHTPLFVVAEESWGPGADAVYRWGSALHGPTGDSLVMTLGPGYDDAPVPGRRTPLRHREDGDFYVHSWDAVLRRRPSLVFVETWNEFHEGTGIAPCTEYGRTYVGLTRRFTDSLRRGATVEGDPIRLRYPEPIPRGDRGWWKGDPAASSVELRGARSPGGVGDGLALAAAEDGPFRIVGDGDAAVICSPARPEGTWRYLYFRVADEFAAAAAGAFEVSVEFLDSGRGRITLHYDSHDRNAALDGAYKPTPSLERRGSGRWLTARFTLPDARLSNRQNGGADFRIALQGNELQVRAVRLVRAVDPHAGEGPTAEVR